VTPPITTIAKIIAQQTMSQIATGRVPCSSLLVFPAKAGTQGRATVLFPLDPRVREGDEAMLLSITC
jgi:hypothetical protein